MKMTGAEAVVRALELEGVDTIFGYPGGAVTHIYDALGRSSIHHVLVRNEQAAAHGANGYARATGKVGVCISTSGPGATNMITGIATAYMDSIPIVAITGQVPLSMVGRDVFQEADITGATEPFTKYSYLVRNPGDLPRIFKEAFHIASTGRPGPVLIDIPKDIVVVIPSNPVFVPDPAMIFLGKACHYGCPGSDTGWYRRVGIGKHDPFMSHGVQMGGLHYRVSQYAQTVSPHLIYTDKQYIWSVHDTSSPFVCKWDTSSLGILSPGT